MEFKVGDKVRIRQWDDMENEFGLDDDGDIKTCPNCFVKLMSCLCGKEAIIIEKLGVKVKLDFFENKSWSKMFLYNIQMIELCKEENNMLSTKEQRTEGMKRQAQELIDQAYQRGFKAGQELREVITFEKECELIEQGCNEAWECAKKIAQMPTEITESIFNQFGLHNIMAEYSASEAIEKLKAWEKKQEQQKNELRVGDEVEFVGTDTKGIVISNKTTHPRILVSDYITTCHVGDLIPTGRYFPEIARVLAKMKEDEDGKEKEDL